MKLDLRDQTKLDTWEEVTTLLDEYHALAFGNVFEHNAELRRTKMLEVKSRRRRLVEKWKKALGPDWRGILMK